MIALFARANHPQQGWSFAHGYVVIGVRCAHEGEVIAVKDKIARTGCRLPDSYRRTGVAAGVPWVGYEWYGGGVGAFDYLATIDGDALPERYARTSGSLGDNRFFWVYDAPEVLGDMGEDEGVAGHASGPPTDHGAQCARCGIFVVGSGGADFTC